MHCAECAQCIRRQTGRASAPGGRLRAVVDGGLGGPACPGGCPARPARLVQGRRLLHFACRSAGELTRIEHGDAALLAAAGLVEGELTRHCLVGAQILFYAARALLPVQTSAAGSYASEKSTTS